MHRLLPGLVMLIVVLALAACAAAPRTERLADRRALFERHAGEPVDSIRSFRMDRFETLGADALAVWASPGRVYLITVRGPCAGLEQRFAIGITSTNRIVRARFDSVTFTEQPSRMLQRCPIETIRPVDFAAVRAEGREAKVQNGLP